ncbi:hypothetical protein AWC13_10605 [Mycobacterium kubicae]|uniref:Uncharacterized protein n=1 Tax=Mycobacterium kubicae TaxID=120959 RepID=A0AAX1JH48_9MYCO|nr:hypothetical protein [Mycobacterium kubicae]ORV99203.1 hypothetical protein AWC13_10605 [Mycobacterium kubicae]QNI12276.1 hypothetical protein GAN18_14595 [Mycobacterium kubicae]QPI40731.1 hypothetical protein I2456_14390 [Mycobacterium kubicae]
MVKKTIKLGAAALGIAVAFASPASADPSAFGTLSCSCQQAVTTSGGGAGAPDQVDEGVRSGLADLQGVGG